MRALALLLVIGCGGFKAEAPPRNVQVAPPSDVAQQPLVALYKTFTGHAPRSDVPELVVYADGLVVAHEEDAYARTKATRGARVTPAQARELAARVVTPGFRKAPATSRATELLHAPITRVVAWLGGDTWKVVAVYGYSWTEHRRSSDPFAVAVRTLREYVPPGGWSAWQPEQVELVLSERDSGEAAPWPAQVPPPPAGATATFRHRVPAAGGATLKAFLGDGPPMFEAEGRRWLVRARTLVPADELLASVLRAAE